jgi:hypothetical protein
VKHSKSKGAVCNRERKYNRILYEKIGVKILYTTLWRPNGNNAKQTGMKIL